MRVSSKNTVQGRNVLEISKAIESNTETTTTQKATTRNAFRQRRKRSKKQESTNTKTGPEPKRKQPQNRFAQGSSGKTTASLSKHANKRIICLFSVRRLHGFRQVVPHVGDMLHMRQIN